MKLTDLDPETQAHYQAIADMRNAIVATINARLPDKGTSVDYAIGLYGLISALADFIALAPEEKQTEIYKKALEILEQAYVINLTEGNL